MDRVALGPLNETIFPARSSPLTLAEIEIYWTQAQLEFEEIARSRHRIYKARWPESRYSRKPTSFDRMGLHLVLRRKGVVVGGARINFARPGCAQGLPCESGGLRVDAHLPDSVAASSIRAEFGGVFADTTRVPIAVTARCYLEGFRMLDSLGVRCMAGNASPQSARVYRRMASAAGWQLDIRDDLDASAIANRVRMPQTVYIAWPHLGHARTASFATIRTEQNVGWTQALRCPSQAHWKDNVAALERTPR